MNGCDCVCPIFVVEQVFGWFGPGRRAPRDGSIRTLRVAGQTDLNLSNVLISNDWKILRVDFTRAFRLNTNLQNPKNLLRCERQLFERFKVLDANELTQRTNHYLTSRMSKA